LDVDLIRNFFWNFRLCHPKKKNSVLASVRERATTVLFFCHQLSIGASEEEAYHTFTQDSWK